MESLTAITIKPTNSQPSNAKPSTLINPHNLSMQVQTLRSDNLAKTDSRNLATLGNLTPIDISKEAFLTEGVNLLNDPRLMGFDKTKYDSLNSMVGAICMTGTSVQQAAVASAFSFTSVLAMPELKRFATTDERVLSIIKWLEVQLIDVAAFFGTKATGAMQELSWQLFSDYGGLTILDFTKFFAMCKKRAFVTEFEYVQTQGINPDFILKWLEKYVDKREEQIGTLSADVSAMLNVDISKAKQANCGELKELSQKAAEMRKAYEERLTETYFRTVSMDGIDTQIRDTRDTLNAAKIRLYHFIINFVAFDDIEAKRITRQIGESLEREYANLDEASRLYFESQNITVDVHKQQEARRLVTTFTKRLRRMGPVAMLTDAMQLEFDCNSVKLINRLGYTCTGAQPNKCSTFAKFIIQQFEVGYVDYLKEATKQTVLPPLDAPDYLIQR